MIEIEGLTHRYDGNTALEDVSLTVGTDEFLLLTGPNGSGKTTLIRHCNGLLEPDSGTVRVDGRSAVADPLFARTSVGMVFQHPRDQFVARTVGADVAFGPENLGLDRGEIRRRVEASLSAVGMAGRRADPIDSLSGGEQARVAIAGALAMEPSYLLLDEPFAGLDLAGRRSVLEHLDGLSEDTGVVVLTHDPRDLLDRATRIVVLQEGSVALDGSPESVRGRLEEFGVREPRC